RSADPRCGAISGAVIGRGIQLAHQGPFGPASGGGLVDGNRLILAIDIAIGSPNTYGIVLATDLASGDRTVVSGKYADPGQGDITVGSGPALAGVSDVARAPDGSFWASVSSEHALGSAPRSLIRIDPATGNRAPLWSDNGNGLKCANASPHYTVDASSIA